MNGMAASDKISIAIAFLTSLIMVFFIGSYHVEAGLLALLAYLFVGVVIPLWNGKRGGDKGNGFPKRLWRAQQFRSGFTQRSG